MTAYTENEAEAPTVRCYNSIFVGSEKNGVLSFKGIPFAKAPVGEPRWKAPQSVEASDEIFDTTGYGKTALQPYASSEPISWNPENMSEDCLTLNIWTTGDTGEKKPVMFYMHYGAFFYGSGTDSLYSGQYMVEEHPDVIIVTANYPRANRTAARTYFRNRKRFSFKTAYRTAVCFRGHMRHRIFITYLIAADLFLLFLGQFSKLFIQSFDFPFQDV